MRDLITSSDRHHRKGASSVEYAILAALVVVTSIVMLSVTGDRVKSLMCSIAGGLGGYCPGERFSFLTLADLAEAMDTNSDGLVSAGEVAYYLIDNHGPWDEVWHPWEFANGIACYSDEGCDGAPDYFINEGMLENWREVCESEGNWFDFPFSESYSYKARQFEETWGIQLVCP